MRKNKKKEIIKLLQSAENRHVAVWEMSKIHSYGELDDLLMACQQEAIWAGTALEEEADTDQIVKQLENYCESLYQFAERAKEGESVTGLYNSINLEISSIKEAVDQNVTIHYEILFLPYKASMWDSLESIWDEARRHDNCRCHVIPLPYFERTQDGHLGEEKSEISEFPDDVPVLNHWEYSIEKMIPDAIFIHNPYDGTNNITSIHPAYYSSRLREYTNCLIYVPYFVVSNVVRKEFCLLPGVLYSNFTILQSERIKNIYCNAILEALDCEYDSSAKRKWEQKFVALGSPKADKIVNTKRKDLRWPNEWNEYLQESEKRKKIVFFNTGIDAFLNHGELVLNKIEYIIDRFRECDILLLLWRPHPLILATLKVQRPNLAMQFEKLVKRFKEEKIGIFDDTTDMNRAVCLSDAYIGDWSSVIWLYQLTGKPILVNSYSDSSDSRIHLDVEHFVWYKGVIWFVSYNLNGIFSMNPEDGNLKYIKELPFERSSQTGLCYVITSFDRYLLLIPNKGKHLVCYDIEQETFICNFVEGEFVSFLKNDTFIYLLPIRGNRGIKYNMRDNEICNYFTIPLKLFYAGCRRETCSAEGKRGYFVTSVDNGLHCYDYTSDEIDKKEIGDKGRRYFAVEYYKGCLILIGDSSIMFVDELTYKPVEEVPYPTGFWAGYLPFCDVIKWNKSLFLIPFTANMIIQLNLEEKAAICFLYDNELFETSDEQHKKFAYTCGDVVGDKIYAFTKQEHCLHVIDIKEKTIKATDLLLNEELKNQVVNRKLLEYESIKERQSQSFYEVESEIVSIQRYINALQDENFDQQDDAISTDFFVNTEGNCGEEIFRFIMNQLKK